MVMSMLEILVVSINLLIGATLGQMFYQSLDRQIQESLQKLFERLVVSFMPLLVVKAFINLLLVIIILGLKSQMLIN
jgi:hypothetical protein